MGRPARRGRRPLPIRRGCWNDLRQCLAQAAYAGHAPPPTMPHCPGRSATTSEAPIRRTGRLWRLDARRDTASPVPVKGPGVRRREGLPSTDAAASHLSVDLRSSRAAATSSPCRPRGASGVRQPLRGGHCRRAVGGAPPTTSTDVHPGASRRRSNRAHRGRWSRSMDPFNEGHLRLPHAQRSSRGILLSLRHRPPHAPPSLRGLGRSRISRCARGPCTESKDAELGELVPLMTGQTRRKHSPGRSMRYRLLYCRRPVSHESHHVAADVNCLEAVR